MSAELCQTQTTEALCLEVRALETEGQDVGLRAGPVQHDPGSWGQDINKAAPRSFLAPFPRSLIFPFFLRLPQLPSSSVFGVLSLLESLAALRREFSFIPRIFSEAPPCAGPCAGPRVLTLQHGVDI